MKRKIHADDSYYAISQKQNFVCFLSLSLPVFGVGVVVVARPESHLFTHICFTQKALNFEISFQSWLMRYRKELRVSFRMKTFPVFFFFLSVLNFIYKSRGATTTTTTTMEEGGSSRQLFY